MTTGARSTPGLLLVLLLALATAPAAGAEAKRVLVVHSFGSTAPPFTTHSTAFESTLTKALGERVDLDEVSLDMARYAQPDMEDAFVEFLRRRLTKWRPDLVVPIGSPSGRFVERHRLRLFPGAPVIYTGMDRRTLAPGPFPENTTFVGESFDLAGLVEDMLQLRPDTNHVAVVIGATPLERYWTEQFRRAFQPFMDRVTFTWLNDLSFDEMLQRVASLPPRSFVLLGLLLRDASGVTHNQMEALQRLHAITSAPINGLFQHELGLGIVGGRLYQAELQGAESARIAIRVLRGEPASSFAPLVIPPQGPRYDWRELQRWGIPESRLPAGSVVEFRRPTVWERYRWWIAGTLMVSLLQAGLIAQLAVTLARRRRSEQALRESEERLSVAADAPGVGLWSVNLDPWRVWATPRLREMLSLPPGQEPTAEMVLDMFHPEDRERVRRVAAARDDEVDLEVRIVRPDGSERWLRLRGHRSVGPRGSQRRWSGAVTDITERRLAEERQRESEARFRIVADSAPVLIWMADVDRRVFFNKSWLDFTGRTAEDEMDDGWLAGVHPDDVTAYQKGYAEAFEARGPFDLQYRLRRHDGEYRWILDHGVPRHDELGRFVGYIGSAHDVTERLRAEERLRQVFEAAPNAMVMVGGDGRIAMVNGQLERVFGYRRDELLGRPIETLIPQGPARPQPLPAVRPVEPSPEVSVGGAHGLHGRRRDGSEVPIEVSFNPIETPEGQFVVASVIDITERRRIEAETQALRQELAHISRVTTMGELLAALGHELSQPLSALLTIAQAGLRLSQSAAAPAELTEVFAHMGYDFDPTSIPRTIDYYLRRTSHGSTLSSIVHAGPPVPPSQPDTIPSPRCPLWARTCARPRSSRTKGWVFDKVARPASRDECASIPYRL